MTDVAPAFVEGCGVVDAVSEWRVPSAWQSLCTLAFQLGEGAPLLGEEGDDLRVCHCGIFTDDFRTFLDGEDLEGFDVNLGGRSSGRSARIGHW